VLATLLLLACSPTPMPEAAPRPIQLASAGSPGPLLSMVADGAAEADLAAHLQVPLVRWQNGKALPAWATHWSWADEGLAVTFTLRTDLRWSDGTPLTPADLVTAWALTRHADVASRLRPYAQELTPDSPVVLGPDQVRFSYGQPGLPERRLWALAQVLPAPQHRLADADPATLRGHPEARAPLSSGPYLLDEQDPGATYRLRPNPMWPEPSANDGVLFRILPDRASQRIAFERGELDLLASLRTHEAESLANLAGVRLVDRGHVGLQVVAWNLEDPVLGALVVRQALALAVDLDALCEGVGTRAAGLVSPDLADFRSDHPRTAHDPDEARRLLAAAGWADPDGDGVLTQGDMTLAFTLESTSNNPLRREQAVRLQAAWAAIGARVSLDFSAGSALFPRVMAREHQAALLGFAVDPFPELDNVASDSAESANRSNISGYSHPQVDAALARYRQATTLEEAAQAVRQVEAQVIADQPMLLLYWSADRMAVQGSLAGVVTDPLDLYAGLEHWRRMPATGSSW